MRGRTRCSWLSVHMSYLAVSQHQGSLFISLTGSLRILRAERCWDREESNESFSCVSVSVLDTLE